LVDIIPTFQGLMLNADGVIIDSTCVASFIVHVNLNQVHEEWVKTVAAQQIHEAAKYYNVFEDLFGEAFFYPVVPLKVLFEYEEDPSLVTPVYRGNLIKPSEVGNILIICHSARPVYLFYTCFVVGLKGTRSILSGSRQ
jgi:hypothetical protein